MKPLKYIALAILLMFLSVFTFKYISDYVSSVGMGRNSVSVLESKQRKVFVSYYNILDAQGHTYIDSNSVIWVEKYYKTMSWDLSETTIINGFYYVYIENAPKTCENIKRANISIGTDLGLFVCSRKNRLSEQIISNTQPDTISIKLYRGGVANYNRGSAIDSFRIVRSVSTM